jgi:DNA-directed RNA polymerase subunit RPC12/RpoP
MNVKKVPLAKTERHPEDRFVFLPIFDAEFERLAGGMTLENPGLCIACGAEAEGVEPDAHHYECEACGERRVYGLEELIVRNWIIVPGEKGEPS